MSTPIQPVPDVILASEFPSLADRPAGTYNAKAKAWADSENAMVTRARETALVTHNNALAAREAADEAVPAAATAVAARDKALEYRNSAAAIAGAIGDDAGLPDLANPGDALVVNDSGDGVEWKALPPPAAVLTPTNVSPAQGSTNIKFGLFQASPYYSLYGKPQKARQMRIGLTPDFSDITWDSGVVPGPGREVSPIDLTGKVPPSTTVWWQMRYQDEDDVWSQWSEPTSFTTASSFGLPSAGDPFGGGFAVGVMHYPDGDYLLITADKASEVSLQWRGENTTTAGTDSDLDGKANTQTILIAGGHPAARYCADYRGGGNDDWYLAAKNELELEYRVFKPTTAANNTSSGANPDSVPPGSVYTAENPAQTSVAAFLDGGAQAFDGSGTYWTSTEYSATEARTQYFGSGNQNYTNKNVTRLVRPVRRLKLHL